MQPKTVVRLTASASLSIVVMVFARSMVIAQSARPDRVLFVSNRADKERASIFTMKPDGSEQSRLTSSDGAQVDPAWSPDGKQIAFAAMVDVTMPKADIHIMNADASGLRQLTKNPLGTVAFGPSWSGDGKRIAYSAAEIQGGGFPKMMLLVIDVDGSNVRQLGAGMLPAWSPDGKRILFTAFVTGQDFEPRLHLMEADGSNARPLVGDGKAMMGVWCPDGKRIAYMAAGGNDQPDIFIMNADGSGRTQLTNTAEEMEFGPQWSADGKRILFSRAPRGGPPMKMSIHSIGADGTGPKQLTNNDAVDMTGGLGMFLIMRRFGG